MAAHRYWALLVTARPGTGNGVAIAEVQMRGTPGGTNLASGGTAGGTNNVGHPPANAFDGNGATEWRDGNTAASGGATRLSYDFGTAVDIVEVLVTTPGAASPYNGATYGPAACWVQWSDDGVIWRYSHPASELSSLGNAATATITGLVDLTPAGYIRASSWRFSSGVAALAPRPAPGGRMSFDLYDGGHARIAGTVQIDGTPATPAARRVRLHDQATGRVVRETWSDAAGAYSFEKLAQRPYYVIAFDHTGLHDPVARDQRIPVP